MFGYVTVVREEMSKEDYALFTAYYCGLCKATGKYASHTARLGLSYDITFLALVLSALTEEKDEFKEFRCMAHIQERRKYAVSNEALEYAACIGTILTYLKLRDDVNDDKSIKAAVKSVLFLKGVKRSKSRYKRQYDEITKQLEELGALERANCAEIDRCADCFAKILECIFTPDFIKDEKTRRVLAWLGYNTGRWIYVADAYNDMGKDRKSGSYNPFLAAGYTDFEKYRRDTAEQLDVSLTFTLENIASSFELLKIYKNKSLLEHIIYTGLKAKQYSILGKNKTNGENDGSI